MWKSLAKFVLKNRVPLLIILFCITAVMGYFASKVKLSYEFAKAIPTDNPKFQEYLSFKQKFGDDGNLMVIAVQQNNFFEINNFKAFAQLNHDLKNVPHVEDVLSVSSAVNLLKDSVSEKLISTPLFHRDSLTQQNIDSGKNLFALLPFYKTILYNPETNAYLIAVRINKEVLSSPQRTRVINDIVNLTDKYTANTKIETHLSGLPLIRTLIADRLKKEKEKVHVDTKLINKAFDMSANESNDAYVSTMGINLRKLDPSFDSRTYGFKTLTQLFSRLRDYIVVDNVVNGLNNPLVKRK